MGRMNLIGMIEQGGDSDAVLSWHLTSNHFPPVEDGVRFARMAIAAVQEGRGGDAIHDPESSRIAEHASDVVESWHLDEFINYDDEGGEALHEDH